MPFVRGHVLPETESTGRTKQALDALLWIRQLDRSNAAALDEIEILREYLRSIQPGVCAINLYVPNHLEQTRAALEGLGIATVGAQVEEPAARLVNTLGESAPEELLSAATTALRLDADVLVADDSRWFPFIPACEKLGLIVAS